jgi:hypothetical protein
MTATATTSPAAPAPTKSEAPPTYAEIMKKKLAARALKRFPKNV